MFLPRRLKKPNQATKIKIAKEIKILQDSTLKILYKLKKIPYMFYKDFLGMNLENLSDRDLKKKKRRKRRWHDFKVRFNVIFK